MPFHLTMGPKKADKDPIHKPSKGVEIAKSQTPSELPISEAPLQFRTPSKNPQGRSTIGTNLIGKPVVNPNPSKTLQAETPSKTLAPATGGAQQTPPTASAKPPSQDSSSAGQTVNDGGKPTPAAIIEIEEQELRKSQTEGEGGGAVPRLPSTASIQSLTHQRVIGTPIMTGSRRNKQRQEDDGHDDDNLQVNRKSNTPVGQKSFLDNNPGFRGRGPRYGRVLGIIGVGILLVTGIAVIIVATKPTVGLVFVGAGALARKNRTTVTGATDPSALTDPPTTEYTGPPTPVPMCTTVTFPGVAAIKSDPTGTGHYCKACNPRFKDECENLCCERYYEKGTTSVLMCLEVCRK